MTHQMRMPFVALALCLAVSVAHAQEYKIAVVNIEAVIANSDAGKSLQSKLQDFRKQATADVKALVDQADAMQKQAQDNAATLSAGKLAELKRGYEDKALEIKRMRQDKQAQGQRIQEQGLKEIEKLLGPVFEKLRAEEGYDLILDSSGQVSSIIMYSEKVDISQLVLDRLNAAGS